MNEREFMLRAVLITCQRDYHNRWVDAAELTDEAHKRGLFDDAEAKSEIGWHKKERDRLCDEIARIERERDEARELLREMAEYFTEARVPDYYGLTEITHWNMRKADMLRRAKEMTDD